MTVIGEMERRLAEVEKYGRKGKGRADLIKFLSGGRLPPTKAILAKCYECNGYNADGVSVCLIHTCPLNPYAPKPSIQNAKRAKKGIPEGLKKYLVKKREEKGKK